MNENVFRGMVNRLLQGIARSLPGAESLRVWAHRARGVKIGANVWIGYDSILETSYPWLLAIGNGVRIGLRVILIGHFRGSEVVAKGRASIIIEDDVYIGPASIILPNVRIGQGAVVAAGSVVNRSIPAMTMAQGNPARPVARCGVPLRKGVCMREFSRQLRPLRAGSKNGSKEGRE